MTLEYLFPEVIDSTILGDYTDCPHSFELARVYGLQGLGGNTHFVAGGAFAKGCEVTRRAFYLHRMSEMDAIVEGVIAVFVEYGGYEPEEKYQVKCAERVAYALVEYFTEYPPSTDKVQPYFRADGKPAVEFEFSFPLEINHPTTGNPLLYGGRFDLVGSYMSSLWVVDEKTAMRLGPQWLKSFSLRGQFLGYCFAAKQFDLPVNGFVVRGVSFLKDYYGHAEVIEVVPEYRLEQWYEAMNHKVEDMVRDYNRGHFHKAFGNACNQYNGCVFRNSLCDKQDWKEWYQARFEVDRWNPLERTKKKAKESELVIST